MFIISGNLFAVSTFCKSKFTYFNPDLNFILGHCSIILYFIVNFLEKTIYKVFTETVKVNVI
jgi:hypothetical protein